MYHSTADSASETISITDSDALGTFALTTRSYCELITSNQSTRHADGRLLLRTTRGQRRLQGMERSGVQRERAWAGPQEGNRESD